MTVDDDQGHLDSSIEPKERRRPSTFVFCEECDSHILRSEKPSHEHDLYFGDIRTSEPELDSEEESAANDDAPEQVGLWYTVRLSYSIDYQFKVPAWDEHDAEHRAKEMVEYPSNCADAMHVHTDRHQISEIFEDDEAAEKYDLIP